MSQERGRQLAYALLKKVAWAGKAIVGATKGINRVGTALSNQLAEAGVQSEVAHLAAKAAPWYGAYRLGKAGVESEPAQKVLEKIRSLRGGSEGEYQ